MCTIVSAELPADAAQPVTYFDLQASWGFTKHLGGQGATDTLLNHCAVGADTLLLEVGCGVGITPCYAAATRGCRVVAVDLSERMLSWALRRTRQRGLEGRVRYASADAQRLPFPDSSFDAVICESVLAFVPDQGRALAEYARVTRPGGYVGIAEGAWLAPPPQELASYMTRALGGPHFHSPDGWAALLRHAGLAIVAAEHQRIRALDQWRGELGRLDYAGAVDYARAWRSAFVQLATNQAFRHYLRTLLPSSPSIFRVFNYFGYAISVGRKGAPLVAPGLTPPT